MRQKEEWHEIDVTITNRFGIHARPAHDISEIAGNYSGRVEIIKNNRTYDAKSISSILGAELLRQTIITLRLEKAEGYEETAKRIKNILEEIEE